MSVMGVDEIIDGGIDDPVFPVCVVPIDSKEVLFVFTIRDAKSADEALVKAATISAESLMNILSEVGVDLNGKVADDFRFYLPPFGETHDDHIHPKDGKVN